MPGSETEAPTVIACNGDIDFESGSLTDPAAKGERHSENPEFCAAKDPPAVISEVIVGNRHKISVPSGFSSSIWFDFEAMMLRVFLLINVFWCRERIITLQWRFILPELPIKVV